MNIYNKYLLSDSDVLSEIKYIMEQCGVKVTEVMQISVSKTDKNSVFVAQPSPWLITGEVEAE